MGLSPELQDYAENIWRRFPAEFISLGSPDLEDFFELEEGRGWHHRVVDTGSQKVIEIVLPRRKAPLQNGNGWVAMYEDEDEDEADSAADFEPALRELERLEAVIAMNAADIPKCVASEVRAASFSQMRIPEAAEDEMVLSPDPSPQASLDASPGASNESSATYNHTPPDKNTPCISPTSLHSSNFNHTPPQHTLPDPEPCPQPIVRRNSLDGDESPNSSVLARISHLAIRREFIVLPVRTSGLRTQSWGAVYRAPHLDRVASKGSPTAAATAAAPGLHSSEEPASPFALGFRPQQRQTAASRPASQVAMATQDDVHVHQESFYPRAANMMVPSSSASRTPSRSCSPIERKRRAHGAFRQAALGNPAALLGTASHLPVFGQPFPDSLDERQLPRQRHNSRTLDERSLPDGGSPGSMIQKRASLRHIEDSDDSDQEILPVHSISSASLDAVHRQPGGYPQDAGMPAPQPNEQNVLAAKSQEPNSPCKKRR